MGSSTVTIQEVVDVIATMADLAPQANPTGYEVATILAIANDTINQLVARRFNWKWNSRLAAPFLTNSWQQDYPQVGLADVGWIESGTFVDVNNTQIPKPNGPIEAARELPVAYSSGVTYPSSAPGRLQWTYNKLLQYGAWPGAQQNYYGLKVPHTQQNPSMAILDANGNILALDSQTVFFGGTTGHDAPQADPGAVEGTKLQDGTCVWVVCSPDSQGWRIDTLPPPAGPVYQIWPKYQVRAPKYTSLAQTIDPVPDDQAHQFRLGFRTNCFAYASDRALRQQHPAMVAEWLKGMEEGEASGDREPDAFRLIPATSIVRPLFGLRRDPRDPGRPY